MQTILKHCTAILSRIIFIGFSIQIVLGILWMCNAFTGFDGPGEGIVCVGAVILISAAVWFMKGSVCEKGPLCSCLFTVLAVVTFPFVMQCLVKPDVRVLTTAVLLFGLGGICRMRDTGTSAEGHRCLKKVCVVVCFWLIAGGLVVGTDTLRNGWTPIATRATERIAWSTLYDDYSRLSEETRGKFSYLRMIEGSYEATGMREIFVPHLVKKLGEEEAQKVLGELRQVAWADCKGQIVKEIIWDTAGYAVSPVVVQLQLAGRAYDSYTGVNYRELLQPNPQLGKLYTDYSCWWFAVAIVCGLLITVMRRNGGQGKAAWSKWIVIVLTGLWMVLGFVMDGAGRMDYKNTLLVLCIWLIWIAGGVQDEKG